MLPLVVQRWIKTLFPAKSANLDIRETWPQVAKLTEKWQQSEVTGDSSGCILKYPQKKHVYSLGHFCVIVTGIRIEEKIELHSVCSVKEVKEM